jgi:hypothetical protein
MAHKAHSWKTVQVVSQSTSMSCCYEIIVRCPSTETTIDKKMELLPPDRVKRAAVALPEGAAPCALGFPFVLVAVPDAD